MSRKSLSKLRTGLLMAWVFSRVLLPKLGAGVLVIPMASDLTGHPLGYRMLVWPLVNEVGCFCERYGPGYGDMKRKGSWGYAKQVKARQG